MDFLEKLTNFSNRIDRIKGSILTEEATKTSIILPFFQLLGYDVFNPYGLSLNILPMLELKKVKKLTMPLCPTMNR